MINLPAPSLLDLPTVRLTPGGGASLTIHPDAPDAPNSRADPRTLPLLGEVRFRRRGLRHLFRRSAQLHDAHRPLLELGFDIFTSAEVRAPAAAPGQTPAAAPGQTPAAAPGQGDDAGREGRGEADGTPLGHVEHHVQLIGRRVTGSVGPWSVEGKGSRLERQYAIAVDHPQGYRATAELAMVRRSIGEHLTGTRPWHLTLDLSAVPDELSASGESSLRRLAALALWSAVIVLHTAVYIDEQRS